MKKLIFLLLGVLLIAVYGCGGQSTAKNSNNSELLTSRDIEMSKDYKGTIHLTKQDFLHKVMNYEEHKEEWVFRGDKPCCKR